MITELRQNEFHKLEYLLNEESCNLEIKSVVLGYNPGWIFVDEVNEPKSAIIWSKGIGGYYLIGKANDAFVNQLSDYFDTELIPRAQALGYNWVEMSGTHDTWNKKMEELFAVRDGYEKTYQRVYRYGDISAFHKNMPSLKEGAKIVAVSPELLQSPYKNMAFLKNNILEWWSDIETFFQKGIGYAVVYEGRIVTTCVTSFMSNTAMESHIMTDEKYRKNGFAKVAVHAFIEGCKEAGISTYWDCMDTNVGSYTLAEYFGYQLKYTYPLYSFKI